MFIFTMVALFPCPVRLTSTITVACFPVTCLRVPTSFAAFLYTIRSIMTFWTFCQIFIKDENVLVIKLIFISFKFRLKMKTVLATRFIFDFAFNCKDVLWRNRKRTMNENQQCFCAFRSGFFYHRKLNPSVTDPRRWPLYTLSQWVCLSKEYTLLNGRNCRAWVKICSPSPVTVDLHSSEKFSSWTKKHQTIHCYYLIGSNHRVFARMCEVGVRILITTVASGKNRRWKVFLWNNLITLMCHVIVCGT